MQQYSEDTGLLKNPDGYYFVAGQMVPAFEEVIVSPIGTFPHPNGDQLCTKEAFDALVAKWREDGEPEILVDFDHASEMPDGATEAAAWATNLRSDEEGLHATFRMTDKGAEALSATRYRYLSPAWYVDEDGHPTELSTIALTNRPNLPVPRLLNSKPAAPAQNAEQEGETHLPAPSGDGEGNPPEEGNTTTPENPDMDKLREILGLAAEVTDEEVYAAVEALRSERDALKAEKAEAEAAAEAARLDAEADSFADEQEKAGKCADRAACKNAYLQNPEMARAIFNAVAVPPPPAPAAEGKPARVVDVNSAKAPDTTDLLANCKSGKERIAWALRHANG